MSAQIRIEYTVYRDGGRVIERLHANGGSIEYRDACGVPKYWPPRTLSLVDRVRLALIHWLAFGRR